MIIEKIFQKDINSLVETDIKDIIGEPESLRLEFKTIPDDPPNMRPKEKKQKEKKNKESIIKSVVGFLNSNVNGLVVLGIGTEDEVANKVQGVDQNVLKQLKSEISLEDFLKESIKAIPSFLNDYSLETKILKWNQGQNDRIVVFIEVKNDKWERIFYSNITQYVYIRKAKSTIQKNLNDTLNLIAERSYPLIYGHLNDYREFTGKGNRPDTIQYNLSFINEGVKTTDKIHCFILVGSDEEIEVGFRHGYSFSLKRLNPKIFNLDMFMESHRYIYKYQYIFPDNIRIDRIYPFQEHVLGSITLNKDEVGKIKTILLINVENSGFVKQEFKLFGKDDPYHFREINREFNPYMAI